MSIVETAGFQSRLAALDISLFESIPSQTTMPDRRSLLAIQKAVAERSGAYEYLEIGSYLGGSIQPHLLDARCEKIYSIDKRPLLQPDERGQKWQYSDNSTARMIKNLEQVSARDVGKVATFDGETGSLDPAVIGTAPTLCFIDGEHTDAAVFRDFQFCLSVVAAAGVICFHDAQIIFRGLQKAVDQLTSLGKPFAAYHLPESVFVIELGGYDIHDHPDMKSLLINSYRGYLWSLECLGYYRDFYNRPIFKFLRKLKAYARGQSPSPVCE